MIDRFIISIDLCMDGNQWSALIGPNIEEGVCGFGDTPEDALTALVEDIRNSNKYSMDDILTGRLYI